MRNTNPFGILVTAFVLTVFVIGLAAVFGLGTVDFSANVQVGVRPPDQTTEAHRLNTARGIVADVANAIGGAGRTEQQPAAIAQNLLPNQQELVNGFIYEVAPSGIEGCRKFVSEPGKAYNFGYSDSSAFYVVVFRDEAGNERSRIVVKPPAEPVRGSGAIEVYQCETEAIAQKIVTGK